MSQKKLFNRIELEIAKEIKTSFELNHFSLGVVHFGGDVIVCMVQFKDEGSLKSNWKEFNSYLTAKFIPTIKDEYSKWNFYIFYFSNDIVPKSLKYEIENNKFSSRKIVIESCESITEEVVNNSITEHITNDNIQVNVESKSISKFKKDVSLAKIIDKLSLNKKNDDDLQNALSQIENTYSHEV
jgi:hypothetical protein